MLYTGALPLLCLLPLPLTIDSSVAFTQVHRKPESLCSQPSPATRTSNFSTEYALGDFAQKSAARLSGAVKIPTMSFDGMNSTSEGRWNPFLDLHNYLEENFPLTHREAKRETVEKYSLLYTLQGSDPTLKPLMLTGHLDVVPAVTSIDRWTYPPFDGRIADGWVNGRGSSDCKNQVVGILSAVEHLFEAGWKPRRTLLLAFGQDEEIGGHIGAANIGGLLEARYGENGIAMIIDEGGMGVESLYGTDFALVGVAEKGAINAYITVTMPGGHSSVPTPRTSIGVLSKIAFTIEDSPLFKPIMKPESPMWGFLMCLSEYGDESLPPWVHEARMQSAPDFDSIAEQFASMSTTSRYLIETSKALTIFNGGVKANALPENASATVNTRIEIFSTHEEIQNTYLDIAKPIAKQYSLLLDGQAYSDKESIGNISFAWSPIPRKPSPISPFKVSNPAWEVLSRANQATFGPEVVSAPSLMTGNTDTRHYWNLTPNIYRWTPARNGTRLNHHTVDEKIQIDTHVDGIRFYTELIFVAEQHAGL